jgi:hypothetical protein
MFWVSRKTNMTYVFWTEFDSADVHGGFSDVQVHFGCRGRFSIPNCRDKSNTICESMNEDYVECFACEKSRPEPQRKTSEKPWPGIARAPFQ